MGAGCWVVVFGNGGGRVGFLLADSVFILIFSLSLMPPSYGPSVSHYCLRVTSGDALLDKGLREPLHEHTST